MKKKIIGVFLFTRVRLHYAVCFVCVLISCMQITFAQGQKEVSEKAETVTVSGSIRIVGNEPFTEVVLTDQNENDWFFFGNEGKPLKVYQGREITVKGSATYKDIILANGKKNGIRRTLKNIIVVK